MDDSGSFFTSSRMRPLGVQGFDALLLRKGDAQPEVVGEFRWKRTPLTGEDSSKFRFADHLRTIYGFIGPNRIYRGVPFSNCLRYSAASKLPCDEAIKPSCPNCHFSKPLMRTLWPVPPGPVFVPMSVQWYSASLLRTRSSSTTT